MPKRLAAELEENKQKALPKRRQLDRRDHTEAVNRILEQHFGNYSEYDVDGRRIGGCTLREQLLGLKRSKTGGQRISSQVIRDLQMQYAPPQRCHEHLAC